MHFPLHVFMGLMNNKTPNTDPHPTSFFSAMEPRTKHWSRVPEALELPLDLWVSMMDPNLIGDPN
jgi:hypothetical protein